MELKYSSKEQFDAWRDQLDAWMASPNVGSADEYEELMYMFLQDRRMGQLKYWFDPL